MDGRESRVGGRESGVQEAGVGSRGSGVEGSENWLECRTLNPMSKDRSTSAFNRGLALFADILDYPNGSFLEKTRECAALLAATGNADKDMAALVAFVEGESVERMEEIYSRAFDITPTTTLYVGYHLFGESYKRGAFLVRLQEEFKKYGFSAGSELADHLCVVLRFASIADNPEFVDPLLAEAILPALAKVEAAFQGSENGYRSAVGALRSFLSEGVESRVENWEMEMGHLGSRASTLDPIIDGGLEDD